MEIILEILGDRNEIELSEVMDYLKLNHEHVLKARAF